MAGEKDITHSAFRIRKGTFFSGIYNICIFQKNSAAAVMKAGTKKTVAGGGIL